MTVKKVNNWKSPANYKLLLAKINWRALVGLQNIGRELNDLTPARERMSSARSVQFWAGIKDSSGLLCSLIDMTPFYFKLIKFAPTCKMRREQLPFCKINIIRKLVRLLLFQHDIIGPLASFSSSKRTFRQTLRAMKSGTISPKLCNQMANKYNKWIINGTRT